MKLRAKGRKVTVPTPPAALNGRGAGLSTSFASGDSTPVNSRREANGRANMNTSAAKPAENIGKYTAPPKNKPWVDIPSTVKPTPYRSVSL